MFGINDQKNTRSWVIDGLPVAILQIIQYFQEFISYKKSPLSVGRVLMLDKSPKFFKVSIITKKYR
jgi:hypothetical protein